MPKQEPPRGLAAPERGEGPAPARSPSSTGLALRPQILLSLPPDAPAIAGVPAAVRTADALAKGGEVLVCTARRGSLAPWRDRLLGLGVREIASYNGCRPVAEQLDAAQPLLLLSPAGWPEQGALHRFIAESAGAASPSAWVWRGSVVAAYFPRAAQLLGRLDRASREFPSQALSAHDAERRAAGESSWTELSDRASLERAESRLYDSLRSDADGYIARLDRTISLALSKRLLRTPVTPNQITAFSLLVGLAGSALLAFGGYGASVLGAAMLWSCCILDGCDGEIARLKLMSSEAGARFDVIADNIVHVAIFAAIPVHLRRLHPEMGFTAPGLVLLAGVLLSMFWVWALILRRPEGLKPAVAKVYERIASRDFIYLVAVLAVCRKLEWFLWSAAVGSHLFWLSLCAVSWLDRKE